MPWGRLDDSLYDHPKLDALGSMKLPCIGLWVLAISWANRHLTDGFVPETRLRTLGGNAGLTERLVAASLLDKAEGGYQIHDYLAFNESREDVKRRREQERERWRKRRASERDSVVESKRDSIPDSVRDSNKTPSRARGDAQRTGVEGNGTEGGSRGKPVLVDEQQMTAEERDERYRESAKRAGLPV